MPSPIGHGLAAIAAGWAIAGPAPSARARWTQGAIFAAVGAAPDLDLLIHRHSAEVHSIGAALIVGVVASLMRWPVARTRIAIGLAVFAAWATHPLLDALAEDSSPPIGVMAFWPISTRYYKAGFEIFSSIYRDWRSPGIITHNVAAIAREVLLLLPIVLIVWYLRRRRPYAYT